MMEQIVKRNRRYLFIGRPLEQFSCRSEPTNLEVLQNYHYNKDVLAQKPDFACVSTVYNIVNCYQLLDIPHSLPCNIKTKFLKKTGILREYKNALASQYKEKQPESTMKFIAKLNSVFDCRLKPVSETVKRRWEDERSYNRRRLQEQVRKEAEQYRYFDYASDEKEILECGESDPQFTFDELSGITETCYHQLDDETRDPDVKFKLRNRLESEFKGRVRFLDSNLLTTLDRIKISHRAGFRLIAQVLKSFSVDLDFVFLSVSTLRTARQHHRDAFYEERKSRFAFPSIVCLHFDGIRLFNSELRQQVEHIVVKATGVNFNELLDVFAIDDNLITNEYKFAELVADHLIDLIGFYEIQERVKLLSYDTAAVNTGASGGIGVWLEKKFDTSFDIQIRFIKLNCRHHELQLPLRKMFVHVFGTTAGAREPFLDRFSDIFNTLDQSKIEHFDGGFDERVKSELLSFIDVQLTFNHKRQDYREILSLGRMFLIRQEQPFMTNLVKPGKFNHSRFMKQLSISFMIYLFRSQLDSRAFKITKVLKFYLLSLKFYFRQWFECAIPSYSPLNDLNTFKEIQNLEDKKLKQILTQNFRSHDLYVTSSLVSLSFFDDRVLIAQLKLIVDNLKRIPQTINLTKCTKLEELITADSLEFFKVLNLNFSFFEHPVETWQTNCNYLAAKKVVDSLHVTNDTAEQSVSIAKFYQNSSTGITSLNKIILSTEQDRKLMKEPTKTVYNK